MDEKADYDYDPDNDNDGREIVHVPSEAAHVHVPEKRKSGYP